MLCDETHPAGPQNDLKDVPSGESISNIARGDLSTVARAQLLADEVKQAAVFEHVSIVSFYCTTTPTTYFEPYLKGDLEPITSSVSF